MSMHAEQARAGLRLSRHRSAARPGPGSGRAARRRGFTLIELVVVVAIVGVLAAAAHPLATLAARRQQEQQLRSALRQIRDALDAHQAAAEAGRILRPPGASAWPPRLQTLVEGVPLAADPRRRLVFLRRLPRDPLADPALPAEATWALRASDSPHDAPRPGRDVYDVHSRSTRRALDGSSYAVW